MFSLDTETGFRDVVFITGAYGLGENVVQGAVDPDEFNVLKPTFARQPGRAAQTLGGKKIKMVYVEGGTKQTTRNVPTPKADRDALLPRRRGRARPRPTTPMKIEAHYGRPMDIEWAKDGIDGKLYIVQARPET